ncbi:MAG TPA: energy transducer TonB [Bryobacteraceae bacterium]|jgi:TonB family protein
MFPAVQAAENVCCGLTTTSASMSGAGTKTETIVARVIQGMRAQGVRLTQTMPRLPPPGDPGGRVVVTDTWAAIDLRAVVIEDTSDSFGADYRIEDELQDFIIQYPIGGRTTPPQVISRVQPKYRQRAGSLGLAGVVVLAATIDESGRAVDVHVEQSVDPELDQEAVKAVSQWRFRPGQEDGHAVRMDVKAEVTFGLN